MTISLVIPAYTITKEIEKLTLECINSFVDSVDEVIVSEDGGFYSPEIEAFSNLYIYSHQNVGFTKNVNRGWKNATGDFVMIANSDTSLSSGNLKDLCVHGQVTCPETRGEPTPGLSGHFFCVPREIIEERGMLNESMKMFCSDTEYESRIKDILVHIPEVKIFHEVNKTIDAAGVNDGRQLEIDRDVFNSIQK
jgi:GT2 family glycosyltransferase